MTQFEIELRQNMTDAAKEDRERFFAVADTLQFQPKYKDKASEIETIKQQMRDITLATDFPNIDWPPVLPAWFPKVCFMSSWKKDEYIANSIKRHDDMSNMGKENKK
ncbi:MAG: hypothetical protein RR954_09525 [Christensenellaceae bacterium]